jgi:hypothetical protein
MKITCILAGFFLLLLLLEALFPLRHRTWALVHRLGRDMWTDPPSQGGVSSELVSTLSAGLARHMARTLHPLLAR